MVVVRFQVTLIATLSGVPIIITFVWKQKGSAYQVVKRKLHRAVLNYTAACLCYVLVGQLSKSQIRRLTA